VLSCDGISSANYGSELILVSLLPFFGLAAFTLLLPMTGLILLGIALVVLSYREVVSVYTRAGGSYVVARDNFGPRIAQVAAALAGHLVPAGSMFAFLAAHRADVSPDADYADLFAPPGVGRPLLPATQMAAVLTLQALRDYSDRETAEAVRFDVRWKVAIGSSLDDAGFDPSSLVYWRNRIARSKRPHRVNDAVKKVIQETGVLKGRRRRAAGSTILADGVSTQDTVTQLVSAIRRAAREVPGGAEQIAAVCTGHDYSNPGKPKIDWDDPQAKDALVSALVNDANALVAALEGRDLEERRLRRWSCWPWSPARTSSPPRGPMAGTGGGGSPARSLKTAWSPPWTPTPGTLASPPKRAATATALMSLPLRRPGSSPMRS